MSASLLQGDSLRVIRYNEDREKREEFARERSELRLKIGEAFHRKYYRCVIPIRPKFVSRHGKVSKKKGATSKVIVVDYAYTVTVMVNDVPREYHAVYIDGWDRIWWKCDITKDDIKIDLCNHGMARKGDKLVWLFDPTSGKPSTTYYCAQ